MTNKTMVGQTIMLEGYGKVAGKQEEVKVVGADKTHVFLSFVNSQDPNDTQDVRFRLVDGVAVGAVPESGYKIPDAALKQLKGTDRVPATQGGRKRVTAEQESQAVKETEKTMATTAKKTTTAKTGVAKKTTAAATAPAEEKKTTTAKTATTATKPAAGKAATGAKKTEEKAKTGRTARVSRTGISEMPTVSKTGIVLRVADKGFFGVGELLTEMAKKNANAKIVLDQSWKKAADIKLWIFVPFEKEQATAFVAMLPDVRAKLKEMGLKGAGFNRSLSGIETALKTRFKIK